MGKNNSKKNFDVTFMLMRLFWNSASSFVQQLLDSFHHATPINKIADQQKQH